MAEKSYNVLFICTHNAVRSIMAEIILNTEGHGRFRAFSAGTQPTGQVDPHVIEFAKGIDYPVDSLRSKGWAEFASPDAPAMDLIITICDSAAGEACPTWPGHPATAQWSFPELLHLPEGQGKEAAFHQEFRQLSERIHFLLMLKDASLDRMALETRAQAANA